MKAWEKTWLQLVLPLISRGKVCGVSWRGIGETLKTRCTCRHFCPTSWWESADIEGCKKKKNPLHCNNHLIEFESKLFFNIQFDLTNNFSYGVLFTKIHIHIKYKILLKMITEDSRCTFDIIDNISIELVKIYASIIIRMNNSLELFNVQIIPIRDFNFPL